MEKEISPNGWMESQMSKHNLTIKELIDVKGEISKFVTAEFPLLKEVDKNNLICIVKKIILLKYVLRQVNGHYKISAMISDLLYLIRSLQVGEERYYYFNIRSIIEHTLRIINDIDTTNTITNSEIMNMTQQVIAAKDAKINFAVIMDEYTKSCLYVHGNENANMNLNEYYQCCLDEKGIMKDITLKLNVLIKLLNELFELIVICQNNLIDSAFHRRKTILKYLLGEKSFSVFESYKED